MLDSVLASDNTQAKDLTLRSLEETSKESYRADVIVFVRKLKLFSLLK